MKVPVLVFGKTGRPYLHVSVAGYVAIPRHVAFMGLDDNLLLTQPSEERRLTSARFKVIMRDRESPHPSPLPVETLSSPSTTQNQWTGLVRLAGLP